MISASEPLEFIPRGRHVVEEHTGPTEVPGNKSHVPLEHVLLQRMQNVNISSPEESHEFWTVREIFKDIHKQPNHTEQTKAAKDDPLAKILPPRVDKHACFKEYMCEFLVNSEEELYVKKNTAVWSKGFPRESSENQKLCLTCETPIRFAFFCNKAFVRGKKRKPIPSHDDEQNDDNNNNNEYDDNEDLTVIGLIDSTTLRVYCSDGEDFSTNLEFPVSNVWATRSGILLEKVASSSLIQSHSISMPRIFSLSHPLSEICPVLNKSAANTIGYLVDSDYTIIYSVEDADLLFMYDSKIGKHFLARMRKATEEEIQFVGSQNDTALSGTAVHHHSLHQHQHHRGASNFSQNSMKFSGTTVKNSSAHLGRTSLGTNANNYTTHISRFLSGANSLNSSTFGSNNRNSPTNPLNQLQSSIGQHSLSAQDIRKIGQTQPSKPIVPEYCLEHFWTENTYGNTREFIDIASRAFVHHDLVGQTYLCYLLPRSCKLQLVRLLNYGDEKNLQIGSSVASIPAKDAVCLNRMKMIAVLDPTGTIILYTNATLIAKVHIAVSMMPPTTLPPKLTPLFGKSPNIPFPRRSSLLPSSQKTETTFDDELHLLSPVHPLQPQFSNRNTSNVCLSLRDPACNRLTLVYSSGKMYRITLPLINETELVSMCLAGFQHILTKDEFLQLITRWYCARNPPGSRDYCIEREWRVFKTVLCDMMGYSPLGGNGLNDSTLNRSASFNADEPKKRRKDDEVTTGTDEDWQFLLDIMAKAKGIPPQKNVKPGAEPKSVEVNQVLFKKIPAIFYCLHLAYEDMKLDESLHGNLKLLAKFLHQLAVDMQLVSYTYHYALDYPELLDRSKKMGHLTELHGAQMLDKELLQVSAPSIYNQLEAIIKGIDVAAYPYMNGFNDLSRNVLQVISLVMHGQGKLKHWIRPLEFAESVRSAYPKPPKRFIATNVPRSEQLIQMLINMRMTRTDISHLPVGVHLIIAECLEFSRLSPPVGCSPETYELILRSELVEHTKIEHYGKPQQLRRNFPQKFLMDEEDSLTPRCPPPITSALEADTDLNDGMDNIDTKLLSLRFPDDMRIAEVRRLLTSSEPVLIDITQSPGTSDHEFIEEQERQLFALATRTMTLPMGRGMFTMRTSMPKPTESMPIPKLCLTGKEPIKGASVEMQQIEFPPNMNLWPSFHNGVAAGLKISPNAREVDSTWIVYNKPKGQADTSTEHAGFLMALGLNGHLKTLSFMSVYEYLVKCDEMTSVGLLLGIAATHRGTMDNTTTKLLSVHIEALLPATALELDIPQNIQVVSLMGIGLLYQGTAKRHIAEVLQEEVGRPPGPEMENCIERESYALTAGLALGLVTLGQGESPAGLRDLQLPDTLHYYMVGGNKRPLAGSQKEKYKLPSFQVREGESVNIDVTAPGATLALGLMFFRTGNQAIAEWMEPPNTRYQLDLVRPDLLMLRTIARGLIMWSHIKPDEKWLFNQFPKNLRFNLETGPPASPNNEDIDHEAITQAYCNIIAGSAFCIGLKYAGTEHPEAFKSLRSAIKLFLGFPTKYVGEYAGRTTIENCLMVIIISISLVFAGSGDLEILRILRYLRSRIGSQHPHVTYGSHMAIHMALGLLFLGAGRYTISKAPEAVAAMVIAFFPKFPIHSNDNRYHLQAFRHLYVLAVEPRLFLPRDIDTKKLCLANISILRIGATELKKMPMAPCMLPELNTLQKVVIDDPNYWPVSFERNRNWQQLVKALQHSACIDIKKRSGCLSHLEDPDGMKSLLSQTLTTEQYTCWEIDPKTLERFSNEPYVIAFTDSFLHRDTTNISDEELCKNRMLTMLFYNAVVKDKMHVLPIYMGVFDSLVRLEKRPMSHDIWQIKLIDRYIQAYRSEHILFSRVLVNGHVEKLKYFIEKWLKELCVNLKQFLHTSLDASTRQGLSEQEISRLIAVIVFFNLPPSVLNTVDLTGTTNYIRYLYEFKKLNLEVYTIFGMIRIMVENDKLTEGK